MEGILCTSNLNPKPLGSRDVGIAVLLGYYSCEAGSHHLHIGGALGSIGRWAWGFTVGFGVGGFRVRAKGLTEDYEGSARVLGLVFVGGGQRGSVI